MNVTLRNDVHHTEATVRVEYLPAQLTRTQQRRVERALCGAGAECICGCVSGPQYTNDGERLSVLYEHIDHQASGTYVLDFWATVERQRDAEAEQAEREVAKADAADAEAWAAERAEREAADAKADAAEAKLVAKRDAEARAASQAEWERWEAQR